VLSLSDGINYDLLLKTVHGSLLYGTFGPDSDVDTYEVHLKGPTRQRKIDSDDLTRINLDSYTDQVLRGVPQALEALYSPFSWIEPDWKSYFRGLRPDYWETQQTYKRTIRNFARDTRGDHYKRRKHALRLYLNLEEFKHLGFFNPVLTAEERKWIAKLVDEGTDGTFLTERGFEIL